MPSAIATETIRAAAVGVVARLHHTEGLPSLVARLNDHSKAVRTAVVQALARMDARAVGLANYLRMDNFIHRNTDGPLNPYAKVYDLKTVEKDFPDFRIVRAYKRFMHAPPLPVGGIPFAGALGWHLWVHMRPAK